MGCCGSKQEEKHVEEYDEDYDLYQNNSNILQSRLGNPMNRPAQNEAERDKDNYLDKDSFAEIDRTKNENINIPSTYMSDKLDKLQLTIKESKFNKPGTTLNITPMGLQGSKRNDGVVYFGLKCDDFPNDFFFMPDEGISKRHFEIRYDKASNGYYVKNFNGSGVFIRIEDQLELRDHTIFSFGTNHLLTNIRTERDLEGQEELISYIKFKVVYGPNKGEE